MRRAALTMLVLAAVATAIPASATQLGTTPYGREDNALGTLRWLPSNANEKPAASNLFRLVVAYDFSLDGNGAPTALKAKGAFGVKIFTTSQVDFKMKGHSASVGDLKTLTGQAVPAQGDETAASVYGDVRDGACATLGQPTFSAAYSTTREFVHPGTDPYVATSGPGACERVDASTEIKDGDGNVTGFTTKVTTFVPGFWIDVDWPTRATPPIISTAGSSRVAAEVWYGAAYDSAGDPGPFPQGVDTTGASKSVFGPGTYKLIGFTAQPGGLGEKCPGDFGLPDDPTTYQDVKVTVPQGAKKLTIKLWPKGDWDLRVLSPDGTKNVDSGFVGGWEETVVLPTAASGQIPVLLPGDYTIRACNFSGEQSIMGGTLIE